MSDISSPEAKLLTNSLDIFLRTTKILERIVAILSIVGLFGIVLLVAVQIIDRYLFRDPVVWTEELARYLFIWTTVLGASLALRHFQLVYVGFILERFTEKVQRIVKILGLVGITFFFYIFLKYGLVLLETAKRAKTVSPGLRAPMYIVYLVFPIGGTIVILFSIACIIEVLTSRKQ
jgi:TRAP-type C4-dicarboxylate transport system permease small subunit